jgi:predicted nucleotidyltransferase
MPDISFEPIRVDDETFFRVAGEAISAMDEGDVPYVFIGGIASAVYGRPRWTHDVDVFVRAGEAHRALTALAAKGFATQQTDPYWLFKAYKEGVLVDVIFRSSGDIFLDEEMLRRSTVQEFRGLRLRIMAPEDLLVIKAVVHTELSPRHWFDALGILARTQLDWDYLVARSRLAARRMLSLLLYAQSMDLLVPDGVIEGMFSMIFERTDEDRVVSPVALRRASLPRPAEGSGS